jgi:nitrite reductase/ring-hydroxylating ferredoxin subunit
VSHAVTETKICTGHARRFGPAHGGRVNEKPSANMTQSSIERRSINRLFLCLAAEIPPGQVKRVLVDGYPPLAVFNLNGAFHVTDDTCTHGAASLSEGEIDGTEIECPFHFGRFDIRTGQAVAAPCRVSLQVYKIFVDGDMIMLDTSTGS